MLITDYNLESLRYKVEQEGGFQIAITPIYPQLFEKVARDADALHGKLEQEGYSVLMDNRNQKPKNMFAVIEFLGIPHRLTLSGRSLEVGVYEYFNVRTEFRSKIKREEVLDFMRQQIDLAGLNPD
jgi:prolyl-tRNA synthetase